MIAHAGRQPRVLLFAPFFPPHRNSEAIVAGKLVLAMLRRGWEVSVVSSSPGSTAAREGFRGLWAPLARVTTPLAASGGSGARLLWSRVRGLLRARHPVRGLSWAAEAMRAGDGLLAGGRVDAVLSRSFPAEGHLPALALARRTGVPWVAVWGDIEPAVRVPPPYGRGADAAVPALFMRYLRDVMRGASHHVFTCEEARRYASRLFPGTRAPSSAIPHLALDVPGGGTPPASTFTLCHAGTFDRHRDPGALFEGVARFLAARPGFPLELRLIGNSYAGTMPHPVPEALADRVRTLPWIGYEGALHAMRSATAQLMIEARAAEPVWLSGKFIDYVQCGRPVLALVSPGGVIDAVMASDGGGERAACDDPAAVAAALARMAALWERGELDAGYPLAALRARFGEERVVGDYAAIFRRIGAWH